MRRSLVLFSVALSLTLSCYAQQIASDTLIVNDGTAVKLRMAMTISSGTAQTGDPVELLVAEDVKAGDSIIIPAGLKAGGSVLMPENRKKKGEVSITISEVTLADGEKAALRAKEAAVSESKILEFFPAAPPYPYINGKDLIIPKDTQVTAFIDGTLKLSASAFPKSAEPAPAAPVEQTAKASEVDVFSTPAGADIEIDGIFIGQTPAAASVPPGEHTLLLRISGYDPWREVFRADGSKLKFAARLTNGGAAGDTVTCWDAAECVNATGGIAAGTTTKPIAQQKKRQNPTPEQ